MVGYTHRAPTQRRRAVLSSLIGVSLTQLSASLADVAPDAAFFSAGLAAADPELADAVARELHRQQSQIELIASENIVSRAVLEAQGSVLTNKYAEGYPGRRYYGGCEFVDVAESLAIERAKRLFACGFANVQPHAGAPANEAVYLALLQPGDPILGMSLAAGGHLTHGAPPNIDESLQVAPQGSRSGVCAGEKNVQRCVWHSNGQGV